MQQKVLTDADYEKQPHLKYKKGTPVKVTKLYSEIVTQLGMFIEQYGKSLVQQWQDAVAAARLEQQAFHDAVGNTYVVTDYTIGANPHGIVVGTQKIFLPAECLEVVDPSAMNADLHAQELEDGPFV